VFSTIFEKDFNYHFLSALNNGTAKVAFDRGTTKGLMNHLLLKNLLPTPLRTLTLP
jgi:hypothetical protein